MKIVGYLKECGAVNLPPEVCANLETHIAILEQAYGAERDLVQDLGGYSIIVETLEDIKIIRNQIIRDVIHEYSDVINCGDGQVYCSSLFVLSSDFSVIVIATKELTNILLEE